SKTVVTADEINCVPALLESPTDHCMRLRALQLDEELKDTRDTELCQEDEDIVRRQNPTTRERTVLLWLDKSLDNLRALGNNESYQERLCRLEGDKESLVLQVISSKVKTSFVLLKVVMSMNSNDGRWLMIMNVYIGSHFVICLVILHVSQIV
ncbi:liprin-beta-2 isoform X1, partial [Tachysurus ichikawai]